MPPDHAATLATINRLLTILFSVECVCKLAAFGLWRFACEPFNLFDLLVVGASLPEVFGVGLNLGFIRVLRMLRVVR